MCDGTYIHIMLVAIFRGAYAVNAPKVDRIYGFACRKIASTSDAPINTMITARSTLRYIPLFQNDSTKMFIENVSMNFDIVFEIKNLLKFKSHLRYRFPSS